MFSVPAAIGFGGLPVGSVVVGVGMPLVTALLVAIVALACGVALRFAVDARTPRIELRSGRAPEPELKRVA